MLFLRASGVTGHPAGSLVRQRISLICYIPKTNSPNRIKEHSLDVVFALLSIGGLGFPLKFELQNFEPTTKIRQL